NWHQVFDIQATLGTSTAIAYASQSYVIGFTESLSPDIAQVVYAGQSAAPVTVTLTPLQNYSSTAKLSCLGPVDQVLGVPISINCAFGSSTLSLSPSTAASTTVTVDRKSTRLNSSHVAISYAVFCLKKKNMSIRCHLIARSRLPYHPRSDRPDLHSFPTRRSSDLLTPLQNYSSTAKLSCLGPVDQVLGVPISINCAFGSSTLSLSPSTAASTTVT